MSLAEQAPSLLRDFLTESGELVERLDADLVRLEHEPASRDLLDGIFRAIHTIKGAASFLALNAVTRFSHTAEDALNKLRKGEANVNADVVIKPLNDSYTAGGPFSGATIREDGDVSLIIDATMLIRSSMNHEKAVA